MIAKKKRDAFYRYKSICVDPDPLRGDFLHPGAKTTVHLQNGLKTRNKKIKNGKVTNIYKIFFCFCVNCIIESLALLI